jgi:hypothetical protein
MVKIAILVSCASAPSAAMAALLPMTAETCHPAVSIGLIVGGSRRDVLNKWLRHG